jgi:putative peptide zinc metalloprotease protein
VEPFLDPAWYRVAELQPRLRAHVRIHRHHYRGERWYVLQDNTTGRFHRFTPTAFEIVARMDGRRSVDAIWRLVCERHEEDPPSQPECIRLLHQLHAADALQVDIPPDTAELLRREGRSRRQRWMQQLRSPLFQRVPLVDPERFLERVAPLVKACFSPAAAVVWVLTMCAGGIAAFVNADELTRNVSDRILDPLNLLMLWIVFPFVKALHELGHAMAVKRWGGEVHEMGIMLLVFSPVPYVDASASSAFADKDKRMLVGAAGMLVELFLAALALVVWSLVEPGAVRTLCYNVVLIAGISTVLFNGNPLLRFDAYYILADWLEIPNLASRANRYLLYLFERYLAGKSDVDSPATTPGEARWFVFYAVASFAYRIFIYLVIITFVITEFAVVGIALAVWAAFSMMVKPLWTALGYLGASPRIHAQRGRSMVASLVLAGVLVGAVTLVPFPLATVAQGIVWVPEEAIVRAGADGFVRDVLADQGESVGPGDALVRLEDPLMATRLEVLEHELAALAARYRNTVRVDRVQAAVTREAMLGAEARLEQAREAIARLTVRSPRQGAFIMPDPDGATGTFVEQGALLGYVLRPEQITVRAVVDPDDIAMVRARTRTVAVRLANQPDRVLASRVRRQVPAASTELPSAALGTRGGGDIKVDPEHADGTRALAKIFHVDVVLEEGGDAARIGARAWVRFDHGSEPVALRWYRSLRALFLRQLDV